MRAAVVSEINRPWTLQQLPDPRPGAGQVLIRIRRLEAGKVRFRAVLTP